MSKIHNVFNLGKWSGQTGHNAPVLRRPGAGGDEPFLNVESTLNFLMDLGGIPEKTVLGVPVFGRYIQNLLASALETLLWIFNPSIPDLQAFRPGEDGCGIPD